MKNTRLIHLIKKLMYGKLSPSNFFSLRQKLRETSDRDLSMYLEEINEDMPPCPKMDGQDKMEVLGNIYQDLLVLEQPSPRTYIHTRWLKIACSILLPLAITLSAYIYLSPKLNEQEFVILSQGNQTTRIMLPDSTEVWLNSDSYLSYSSNFNRGERHVKLKGEAFFEVKHNQDSKFVVETDSLDVVVYGTSFNVSSYGDENQIAVSLVEGKVVLKGKNTDNIMAEMIPNTLASFNKKDRTLSIQNCDAAAEGLWTKNMLRFENAHANEIFYKLERWYNLNIHVDNLDTQITYGFTLKDESIKEMLNLINRITPIAYRIDGKEVYIKYL